MTRRPALMGIILSRDCGDKTASELPYEEEHHMPLRGRRMRVGAGDLPDPIQTFHGTVRRGSKQRPADPANIEEIRAAIKDSHEMAAWEQNWNGRDSPGNKKATMDRAGKFIEGSVRALWRDRRRSIEVPEIAPGHDGSIDIHWETDKGEILINVPAQDIGYATFYGEGTNGEFLKGKLSVEATNEWVMILKWLAQQ